MVGTTPAETIRLADEAFNRGDLDTFLSYYENDAVIQFEPAKPVIGMRELRLRFQELLPLKPIATQERVHLIECGDLALATTRWNVSFTNRDGTPVLRGAEGTSILRRGADGVWRVAVENPWGARVLAASAVRPVR
jgi:ketosteroid isomerase-like protein